MNGETIFKVFEKLFMSCGEKNECCECEEKEACLKLVGFIKGMKIIIEETLKKE